MGDKEIGIELILRSASGRSILEKTTEEHETSHYSASPKTVNNTLRVLRKIGFNIVTYSENWVYVKGKKELVQKVFGDKVLKVPTSLQKWVEDVRFPTKVDFF